MGQNSYNDVPPSLSVGGRSLWVAVNDVHPDLDAIQRVQLLEACRAKDRLDRLNLILCGDAEYWTTVKVNDGTGTAELKIDAAMVQVNATANMMKQLLASLRLPDVRGKKPQFRGTRGAYVPQSQNALDRMRKAS